MKRRCVRVALIVAIVGVAAAGPSAIDARSSQQTVRDTPVTAASNGRGLIAGAVVVDDLSGPQPLRHALVTLSGTGVRGGMQILTDDEGRFGFPGLAAGRYTLTAERAGYVRAYYGSKLPARGPATPIALANAQQVTDIRVGVLRGAVITGTIYNEQHQPMPSAQVHADYLVFVNGERRAVLLPGGSMYVTTDERGIYRIYGLPSGDYRVFVGGGSGTRTVSSAEINASLAQLNGTATEADVVAATRAYDAFRSISSRAGYFPGVDNAADAEVITLTAGEERTGVDVTFRPVHVASIEGTIVGPDGQPFDAGLVGVINASTGSTWISPGGVRPGPDGRFRLSGLMPSTYRILGRTAGTPSTNGASPMLWTSTDVVINGADVTNVVVLFQPGMTVSGRLVFNGTRAPADLSKVRVRLAPAVTGSGDDFSFLSLVPATPHDDGTFTIGSLVPAKYRVVVDNAAGWSVRSAMTSGHDTLDDPLEVLPDQNVDRLIVTLTDRVSEISGTMFDALGRQAPGYTVFVFPTNRAWWTSAPRRTSGAIKVGSEGAFKVVGLPPGEYYLSAITDVDPIQLQDPSVLEQIAAAAIRITLAEGEKKTQDVKIGG